MKFHIHKTEDLSVPDYPDVDVSLKQVSWHKTPIGYDEEGDPIYDEVTPEHIEKTEFFRAYRVLLMRYTRPISEIDPMDGLVQKQVVSPWFDTRDPDADEKAKREVLGLAVLCAISPVSSIPLHTEADAPPHTCPV